MVRPERPAQVEWAGTAHLEAQAVLAELAALLVVAVLEEWPRARVVPGALAEWALRRAAWEVE